MNLRLAHLILGVTCMLLAACSGSTGPAQPRVDTQTTSSSPSLTTADVDRAKAMLAGNYVESSRGTFGWMTGPKFANDGTVTGTYWIGQGETWPARFASSYEVTSASTATFRTESFRDSKNQDRVVPALTLEVSIKSEDQISLRIRSIDGQTGFVPADVTAFLAEYSNWRPSSKIVTDDSTFQQVDRQTLTARDAEGYTGQFAITTYVGLRGTTKKMAYPNKDLIAIKAFGAEDVVIPFLVEEKNVTDRAYSTEMTYTVSAQGAEAGTCYSDGCSPIAGSGISKSLQPGQSAITPGYVVLRNVASPAANDVDISDYLDAGTKVTIRVKFSNRIAATYVLQLATTAQGPALTLVKK